MYEQYIVSAEVTEQGALKMADHVRTDMARAMKYFKPGPVDVVVRVHRHRRSSTANALYWAGFVKPLSDHTGYDEKWIHAYLKKRFLPGQHLLIQDKDGVVVDEADLEPSTTTLTEEQFSEYLRSIEVWALEELGVVCGSNREGTG